MHNTLKQRDTLKWFTTRYAMMTLHMLHRHPSMDYEELKETTIALFDNKSQSSTHKRRWFNKYMRQYEAMGLLEVYDGKIYLSETMKRIVALIGCLDKKLWMPNAFKSGYVRSDAVAVMEFVLGHKGGYLVRSQVDPHINHLLVVSETRYDHTYNAMVQTGLVKVTHVNPDSVTNRRPHFLWEVTAKGKALLKPIKELMVLVKAVEDMAERGEVDVIPITKPKECIRTRTYEWPPKLNTLNHKYYGLDTTRLYA